MVEIMTSPHPRMARRVLIVQPVWPSRFVTCSLLDRSRHRTESHQHVTEATVRRCRCHGNTSVIDRHQGCYAISDTVTDGLAEGA